jgi:SNF2 family DNA or RNA helicase
VVICDEAHYLKSVQAQRTVSTLGSKSGLVTPEAQWWLLSGTPSPNHYGELFTALAALWPGMLLENGINTYDDFLNEFTVWEMIRYGSRQPVRKIHRSKNGPKLAYLLSQYDVMLRRTFDEVGIQLPGIFWQDVPVLGGPFTGAEDPAPIYTDEQIEEILGTETLAWASERKRIGLRKTPSFLTQLLDTLSAEPTSKHVVMAYHHEVLDQLEEGIRSATTSAPRWSGVVRVDGSTSLPRREEAVRAFQNDPSVRVFIGQSVACREAITLTAARTIHILEPHWTPEYNVQLAGRIRRISQTADHVIARMYFCLDDPLDAALTRTLIRKAQDMEKLYG